MGSRGFGLIPASSVVGFGAYGMVPAPKLLPARRPTTVKAIITDLRRQVRAGRSQFGFRFGGFGENLGPTRAQVDAAKADYMQAMKALNRARGASYSSNAQKDAEIAAAESRFNAAKKFWQDIENEYRNEQVYQVDARAKAREARATAAAAPAPLPAPAPAPAALPAPAPPAPVATTATPVAVTPAVAVPAPVAPAPAPVIIRESDDESFGFGPVGNMVAAGVVGLMAAGLLLRRR